MSEVEFIFAPSGRNGKGTMTVQRGDTPLFVDSIDLTKLDSRRQFAERLTAVCPGIQRDAEAKLLKLGAERATAAANTTSVNTSLAEVDATAVVRAERFILPCVNGFAVPILSDVGGKVAGRWRIYLQWADGKREARELGAYLDTPSGRVWLSPEPSPPSAGNATSLCGWSSPSRREWLDGAESPKPDELFKRLAETFAYFVDVPADHGTGTCATVVLWSMLTYIYTAWPAIPYLHVTGPAGSGKSRLFELLARTTFRPLSSSNLTGPALFRTLHDRGGTLLYDEAERLKQTQSPDVGELLSMLLAGYKRGGQATRLESVGDKFQTVSFDVFGPKALACIAGLPTALSTRCISVPMFRSSPGSLKPRRRIDADPDRWRQLRDDLHRFALAHGPAWLDLADRHDVCPNMSGRDFELWQPLLGLAAWLDDHGAGGLHAVVQEHALRTIDDNRDDHTPDADEVLLRIIADAHQWGRWLTADEVLTKAKERDDRTFERWGPRTVTARLKSYGIPKPTPANGRREFRGVTDEVLRRVQSSYGIDLGLSDEVKR